MCETRNSSLLGKITVLVVICCLVMFGLSVNTAVALDGSGTQEDPLRIESLADFNEFASDPNYWDDYIRLDCDIDLSGRTYTKAVIAPDLSPPGCFDFTGIPLTGVFDGNNNVISNLTIVLNSHYTGLFGYIAESGQVKNLGLEGCDISSSYATGCLAGHNDGLIINCYATGSIDSTWDVGGLVGINEGEICCSYAASSVSGSRYLGGLVGWNSYGGKVANCYATGNVTGDDYVGGLIGSNFGNWYICNTGLVSTCYATGTVTGYSNVGGLVGESSGAVYLSYWNIQTSGQTTSAGGIGKSTAEMMSSQTYRGWGYDSTWTLGENEYPRLIWEQSPGQLIFDATRTYGGGSGEPHSPYLIATAEQLSTIGYYRDDWNKNFALNSDIDMSGYDPCSLSMIGIPGLGFTGLFNGTGYAIENLTSGLFWLIGMGGEIKNLDFLNVHITSSNGDASLIHFNAGGFVSHCHANGSFTADGIAAALVAINNGAVHDCWADAVVNGGYAGGLVGTSGPGEVLPDVWVMGNIYNCYATGTVTGYYEAGGLVGDSGTYISRSYSDADVVATATVEDSWAGGLVGYSGPWGGIFDCYATGSVYGNTNVGGLAGESSGVVKNCYAIGDVNGTAYVGGLVGLNGQSCELAGSIVSSFWDVESSNEPNMCGGQEAGATGCDPCCGKTTEEMQDANTFIEAGWDFERPIWMICGQDYPKLIWNYPDINGDGQVDFSDFATIATMWMVGDCAMCNSTDLTGDRHVNNNDLLLFTEHWLEEDEVSDHVFEIEINMGWDYEDPNDSNDTEYEFELWVGTDDRVQRVEFLAPSGKTFEIPQTPWQVVDVNGGYIETEWEYDSEDNVYGWMHYAMFNEPNGLAAYGDGGYTITVHYDNGRQHQTAVLFSIPDTNDPIPQPTQEPVPVFPVPDTNVTSPVTFTWEPCTDANAIWLSAENVDTGEEVEPNEPLPKEATSWGPVDLSEGLWEVDISFGNWYEITNSDGIYVFIVKYSEIDYEFTVVP